MKWAETQLRDRDALLHTAVFGIAVTETKGGIRTYQGTEIVYDRPVMVAKSVPFYSTDIAAAMELAEAMREKEWRYHIEASNLLSVAGPFGVTLLRDVWEGSTRIYADTLPAAIAECVYKALGGE